MKRIIYGESNYKKIRTQKDYLYIDKTRFIEVLEEKSDDYLVFLRPRRFGKSLFLSTLWHYYDERFESEFEHLFRETYIGVNPTPLRNSYRVLFLEFSGIEVDRGMELLHSDFLDNLKQNFSRYLSSYGYDERYVSELYSFNDTKQVSKRFFEIVNDDKIYLIIDEYDQFANALLAYDIKEFLNVVGKGGFVRSFYEVLKTQTMVGTLHKMFITGVTPITLDSLSSGFNIVKNISNHKLYNELAGFTTDEVIYSIKESIAKKCDIDVDKIVEQLKHLYNGYQFNIFAPNRVYNSTMVNFFLSEYDTDECRYPQRLLDPNVASDYGTIMKLFNIGNRENNFKVLNTLLSTGEIKGTLKDRYDLEKGFFEDDFITLIYSMGLITNYKQLFGSKIFAIPNYMMRVLYFNYFGAEIEKRTNLSIQNGITNILIELALGNIEPFKEQINSVIKTLCNRDFMKFDEKYLQTITLTLLSFAQFYYIESQKEIDRKLPDIVVTGRKPFDEEIQFNYMFELKWVNANSNYNSKKQEGIDEVKEYLNLSNIKEIKNLYSYVLVGSKDGVEFIKVT